MSNFITNAELRIEAERLCDENDQLAAENAKLRELAGRMLSSIRRFEICSDSYSVSSLYEQWMRELGVEVDA